MFKEQSLYTEYQGSIEKYLEALRDEYAETLDAVGELMRKHSMHTMSPPASPYYTPAQGGLSLSPPTVPVPPPPTVNVSSGVPSMNEDSVNAMKIISLITESGSTSQ